jgi:epoxide hydrolase
MAEVRPFRIDVPEAELTDLRRRLRQTHWPEREPVANWSQGVPLAYLRERSWTDHPGSLEAVLSRDELLDNLMLYWLPGTGASSARLYWESIRQVNEWIGGTEVSTVDVPAGCSVFPCELQRPSRRWAEKRFTDIRYWNEPARGGHFAAFEQPEPFVQELRAFFRLARD